MNTLLVVAVVALVIAVAALIVACVPWFPKPKHVSSVSNNDGGSSSSFFYTKDPSSPTKTITISKDKLYLPSESNSNGWLQVAFEPTYQNGIAFQVPSQMQNIWLKQVCYNSLNYAVVYYASTNLDFVGNVPAACTVIQGFNNGKSRIHATQPYDIDHVPMNQDGITSQMCGPGMVCPTMWFLDGSSEFTATGSTPMIDAMQQALTSPSSCGILIGENSSSCSNYLRGGLYNLPCT